MAYRIAGIDVHKTMLAVVIADVEVDGEWPFERQRFGASPSQLRLLTQWLIERQVEDVVMESTALYWRPVWDALERDWQPARRARGTRRRRAVPCISRKRSPMPDPMAASVISPMPSDW